MHAKDLAMLHFQSCKYTVIIFITSNDFNARSFINCKCHGIYVLMVVSALMVLKCQKIVYTVKGAFMILRSVPRLRVESLSRSL